MAKSSRNWRPFGVAIWLILPAHALAFPAHIVWVPAHGASPGRYVDVAALSPDTLGSDGGTPGILNFLQGAGYAVLDNVEITYAPAKSRALEAEALGQSAWHKRAMGAESLPDGGQGVTVAVIDSGMSDATGRALFGTRFRRGTDTYPACGTPENGDHAVAMAGLIAASPQGTQTGGVARGAHIVSVCAVNQGSATVESVSNAIVDACNAGADVISYSLGSNRETRREWIGILDALGKCSPKRGRSGRPVFVASAPEVWDLDAALGSDVATEVAKREDIVIVTAHDERGLLFRGMGIGRQTLALAAPGHDVVVPCTLPGGVCTMSGSSPATALVSGAIAWKLSMGEAATDMAPVDAARWVLARAQTDAFLDGYVAQSRRLWIGAPRLGAGNPAQAWRPCQRAAPESGCSGGLCASVVCGATAGCVPTCASDCTPSIAFDDAAEAGVVRVRWSHTEGTAGTSIANAFIGGSHGETIVTYHPEFLPTWQMGDFVTPTPRLWFRVNGGSGQALSWDACQWQPPPPLL